MKTCTKCQTTKPLRGKTVSGLHVPENLRVIQSAENKRKAAKLMEANHGI